MIFGAGSKVVPALLLTNLWTLVLLFLAWNHSARNEVAQSVSNVGEWLGVPPDGIEWSAMGEDPFSSVPEPNADVVRLVTATRPAPVPVPVPGPVPDPNLPAFCPECGEGDLLCAKYGLVSISPGRNLQVAHTPAL
jgi:hypothetical protein